MISTPPTSGPTSVAPLKAAEVSPMALKSSRSDTRRGTIAWRVGASKEKMIEFMALIRTTSTMLMCSEIVRTPRRAARAAALV